MHNAGHGATAEAEGAQQRSPLDDGRDVGAFDGGPGVPLDEFDSATEVAASFTTQRRVSVGYFIVFLLVTFAVPTLSLTLSWWSDSRIVGGMSPSFVMAAGGLYLFFLVVGIAVATLASAIEDRMLGGTDDDPDSQP